MGIPAPRDMSALLGDILSRVTLVERRLSRASNVAPMREWAAKGGPTSYVSPYLNTWAKGVDSGGSIDAHTHPDHIIIGESGVYEVVAMQRGNGVSAPDGYGGLALNGDRLALENRAEGMYSHDHSPANNANSTSRYLGPLTAGELITFGPPTETTGTYLVYSGSSISGSIYVRRVS